MADKVSPVLTIEPFEVQLERIEKVYQELLPSIIAQNPNLSLEEAQKLAAEVATDMATGHEAQTEKKRPN